MNLEYVADSVEKRIAGIQTSVCYRAFELASLARS